MVTFFNLQSQPGSNANLLSHVPHTTRTQRTGERPATLLLPHTPDQTIEATNDCCGAIVQSSVSCPLEENEERKICTEINLLLT